MDYKKMYQELAEEIRGFTYSDEDSRCSWTHEETLERLQYAMTQMDRLEEGEVISEYEETILVSVPKLVNWED